MADGGHIALSDEQVRLAEGDAPVEHLGRPRDDEQGVAILFQLGPLVRASALDVQFVQVELSLERGAATPGRARAGRSRPRAPACATTPASSIGIGAAAASA